VHASCGCEAVGLAKANMPSTAQLRPQAVAGVSGAMRRTSPRLGCYHARKSTRRCRPQTEHAWLVKGKGKLTAAHKDLVRAILVAQLGSIALARLELDGDLLLVEQVGALENDAKATLANLLPDAVVDAHHVGRRRAAAGHVDARYRVPCRGCGDRRRNPDGTAAGNRGCAAEQQTSGGRSSDGAAAAAKERVRRGE
jgi:hypothetical protein